MQHTNNAARAAIWSARGAGWRPIEYDGTMVFRLLTALVGALVITASLLLGMDALTSVFRERDAVRYFRITDILPSPEPGKPERPAPVRRQPEIEQQDVGSGATSLPVGDEAPPEPALSVAPAVIEPELELPSRETGRD